MLEIILVVILCKSLGKRLRAKGWKPFWMQFLLVVLWFGGEIAAGFIAGVVHVVRNGPDAPMGLEIYLYAIAGAALGSALTFLIAHLLPDRTSTLPPEASSPSIARSSGDPNNPYAP